MRARRHKRRAVKVTLMLRVALGLAVSLTFYLALTPGPAGKVIADGTTRHMLAFLVLPWLTMLAYPRLSPVRILVALALFGGVIEVAQLLMDVGRHGSWLDWLLDVATVAVAVSCGQHARSWLRARGRRRSASSTAAGTLGG
jgi:hypothetical protein